MNLSEYSKLSDIENEIKEQTKLLNDIKTLLENKINSNELIDQYLYNAYKVESERKDG